MKARLCTVFVLVSGLALALAWVVAAHQPEPENRQNKQTKQTASTPITLNLNLGATDPTLDPALGPGGASASHFVINQLFLGSHG